MAVIPQALRHVGVDLGSLTCQDEQFLAPVSGGVVEHSLDFVRSMQMRLVCRERAVLAVALTGARQREREVARESDASHGRKKSSDMKGAAPVDRPLQSSLCRPAYRGGLTSWRRPFGPVSGVAARMVGASTNRYQYASAARTAPTIGAKM
jgi:hypothetical protein